MNLPANYLIFIAKLINYFSIATATHFAENIAALHPSRAIKKHPSHPRERKVRQTAKPQFLNHPSEPGGLSIIASRWQGREEIVISCCLAAHC